MDFLDVVAQIMMWIALLFLFLSVVIYFIGYRFRSYQNRLLYYPEMPPESRQVCESPSEFGIQNSETVSIYTADGLTLRGFMIWPGNAAGSTSPLAQTNAKSVGGSSTAVGVPVTPKLGTSLRELECSDVCRVNTAPLSFVLIYFHGNAGNVGHRIPIANLLTSGLGCAVLMVDYRGYGRSDNAEITEKGLELDAQACFEHVWADPRVPRDRIFVMGTSLGGAVAINLAASPLYMRRIAGLILENTFTSISDMASTLGKGLIYRAVTRFPGAAFCCFNYYLKPLILGIGWTSVRTIRRVKAPMLFMSGLQDELVPPTHMRTLFNAASAVQGVRKLVEFQDGMHNNMPAMPGYIEAIRGFVDAVGSEWTADVV